MLRYFWTAFFALLVTTAGTGLSKPTFAGIEQLLIENVPVPLRRPAIALSSLPVREKKPQSYPAFPESGVKITAKPGSLKSGLDAVSGGNVQSALRIRAGMKPGSLDRKILAWTIALSGQKDVPSSELLRIARGLADWPGRERMIGNAEKAFANERPNASAIISAFRDHPPATIDGAILLARALISQGNRPAARRVLAAFWHSDTLSEKLEKRILSEFGNVLTTRDHRIRMQQMFYEGNYRAGSRMGAKAEQFSLSKAWSAVLRGRKNAPGLIAAVADASKADLAYQFVRITHARRTGEYKRAAKLLLSAPRNRESLINPDAWWNERRIVSRQMLELGDTKTAYRLVSDYAASSPSAIAEAEFHAGWYALRALNNRQLAKPHFQRVIDVTSQPISQSRGYYWLARASEDSAATKNYAKAAQFHGTFYGQLAAAKLGTKKLTISHPRPTPDERKRFEAREHVRAIKRLEANKYGWRAEVLYRHLAKTLRSEGELALLSARAERKGKNTLALQIGKLANARGLAVDNLAWPIGAIPPSKRKRRTSDALAYAIARQESGFNVAARSPANARGLLQLLPGTARAMARDLGVKYSPKRLVTDGGYNATLGAAYLAMQKKEFNGSYVLTFAAYNAGPRRAREWVGRFGDPRSMKLNEAIDWIESIPFGETRNYVQRVMENYQVYKARIEGSGLNIVADLTTGRR